MIQISLPECYSKLLSDVKIYFKNRNTGKIPNGKEAVIMALEYVIDQAQCECGSEKPLKRMSEKTGTDLSF